MVATSCYCLALTINFTEPSKQIAMFFSAQMLFYSTVVKHMNLKTQTENFFDQHGQVTYQTTQHNKTNPKMD